MLGEDGNGTPDDILDIVSQAGYEGIEFSNAMIGPYLEFPGRFEIALQKRDLACAAFAYATTGFTQADQYEKDLAGAHQALAFCAALGCPLCLGGAASPSREGYDAKWEQALRFYRAVAVQGAKQGVPVCVHPHSHHGSLIESTEEYHRLLSLTADSGLMFNPDAGHIVRGGQELMDCIRSHRDRIVHVHIKDVDQEGHWQPLGKGIIPWQSLFDFLRETGYTGWIVAEEESSLAKENPSAAVAGNRNFLRTMGL
jgi:sugar phosphate isomerase/epimerase